MTQLLDKIDPSWKHAVKAALIVLGSGIGLGLLGVIILIVIGLILSLFIPIEFIVNTTTLRWTGTLLFMLGFLAAFFKVMCDQNRT